MSKSRKPKPNLKLVRIGAKWWADVIYNGAKQDNGDVMQSAFAGAFTNMLESITKEQRDIFEENLYKTILDKWDEWYFESYGGFMIIIDYGVGGVLKIAKEELEIDDLHFPMKTDMKISTEKVEVSYGYGAKWEEIKE